MRKSKILALVLVMLLAVSLFAACGGNNAGSDTDNGGTGSPSVGGGSDVGNDDNGPFYNYAKGNFEADEKGMATQKYEYKLPLTNSDEVLTFWTSCYTPNYISTDYSESPFPIEVENRTGVNIEYQIVGTESRAENFSVLIASDSLPDIMSQANYYYSGVFKDGILEDEYFANLYDYREYAPNYFYEVNRSPDDVSLQNAVYMEDDVVGVFYALRDKAYQQNALFVRSDWLDRIGWSAEDIVTWEDTHDLLTQFKQNIETATYPLLMFNVLEAAGNHFICFDTLCYVSPFGLSYLVDENKQVFAANTTFRDYNLISELNKWYNEGLIDPNWSNYDNMTSEGCNTNYYNDMYGYIPLATSDCATEAGVLDAEGASWIALKDPVLYEGQTLHIGGQGSRLFMGSACISATCENIPLAMTWCDWRYSDSGADLMSWGVEGYAWELNENGERQVTEFIHSNPEGFNMTMLMLIYCMNTLCDPGLDINSVHYTFPGGEKVIEAYDYLSDRDNDGAFDFPSSVVLTAEQMNEVMAYSGDVMTFIQENYLAFLDNSKPLSEWDEYEATLHEIGLDQILAIYQQAYDEHMAEE